MCLRSINKRSAAASDSVKNYLWETAARTNISKLNLPWESKINAHIRTLIECAVKDKQLAWIDR